MFKQVNLHKNRKYLKTTVKIKNKQLNELIHKLSFNGYNDNAGNTPETDKRSFKKYSYRDYI